MLQKKQHPLFFFLMLCKKECGGIIHCKYTRENIQANSCNTQTRRDGTEIGRTHALLFLHHSGYVTV